MRNTRWLRYGIASIIVTGTAVGALLAACGDDDTGGGSSSGTSGGPDSGTDTGTGGDTGASTDSGSEAAVDAGAFAKLTLVNASTDMGPDTTIGPTSAIRVCFKQGTNATNISIAPYPPLPDKPPVADPTLPPGIYPGTGGTFPSFGLDLSTRIIVPIVMNAKTLKARNFVNPGDGTPGKTCDEILDPAKTTPALEKNKDFWELPQIDAGSFLRDKSYLLALTGCVGNATKTIAVGFTAKCGSDDLAEVNGTPGNGNLKVRVFEVNRVPTGSTTLGVQVVFASPQAKAIFSLAGITPNPGFMSDPADAGSFTAATADAAAVVYPSVTPAFGVSGVNDGKVFVTAPTSPFGAAAPIPLPFVEKLTYPDGGPPAAPTIYKNGKNFAFILIGDPDFNSTPQFIFPDGGAGDGGDGSRFNTEYYHYLAFPTDPDVVPYKP